MSFLIAVFCVVAAVAGVAAAAPLCRYARRRALAQPLPADPDAEAAVLAAVLADRARLVRCSQMRRDDFTVPEHQVLWDAVTSGTHGARPFAALVADAATGPWATLPRRAYPGQTAADVVTDLSQRVVTERTLTKAAVTVMRAAADRETYASGLPVIYSDDPAATGPLERPDLPFSVLRRWTFRVAMAIFVAAGVTAGTAVDAVAAAVVVMVVATVGLVVAAVDADTLFLDKRTTVIGTVVVAVTVVADAIARDRPAAILVGAVTTVAVVAVFEVMNAIVRAVRGVWGSGSGDTAAAVLFTFAPVTVTGSVTLGACTFLAGFAFASVAGTVLRLRGRDGSGPLLPHFAAAFPAAVFVTASTGTLVDLVA